MDIKYPLLYCIVEKRFQSKWSIQYYIELRFRCLHKNLPVCLYADFCKIGLYWFLMKLAGKVQQKPSQSHFGAHLTHRENCPISFAFASAVQSEHLALAVVSTLRVPHLTLESIRKGFFYLPKPQSRSHIRLISYLTMIRTWYFCPQYIGSPHFHHPLTLYTVAKQ